ncbi:MAG: molybdopterin-dependent oxidoreductase [Actinomycetales bacterium]|nr:molybdopterin-dependent oxidoreductase [Actinomycetales bacterium]
MAGDRFDLRPDPPARPSLSTTFDRATRVPVGRRVFLGVAALGALGVAVGTSLQSRLASTLGSGLGRLLPGGDHFRIYSLNGVYPTISDEQYHLDVTGLVERPTTFTLGDLKAMPATTMVKTFQCVTGWRVPDVHWVGVRLTHILESVGVKSGAVALTFESFDGADTESLTLEQAQLPDVIVAYSMLGTRITAEHGGPVRLYVAPMYGYKSLKWLSAIRVVDAVAPGYWELNGYPVNGWLDGSTGPTNPDAQLT